MRKLKIQFIAGLSAVAFLILLAFYAAIITSRGEGVAQIWDQEDRIEFKVEIADNWFTRAQGLMNREALAPYDGMLFLYEDPQPVQFWMKNTSISLDIIFIDRQSRISNIQRISEPHSTKPIPSDGDVIAVLEVSAGTADTFGLDIGDKVSWLEVPNYQSVQLNQQVLSETDHPKDNEQLANN